ncbi:MAG TPA: D-alanyl-D-alanine carboxypeptidase [Actinomycetota bacterium]|nr:D-alanyl-D-alanine carboxypeptidase [Actinomycetota bacterium]
MPGAHARRRRRIPFAIAALLGLVVLVLPTSGDAEATASSSVTLQSNKTHLVDGGWVQFSGSVSSPDINCETSREVRLRSLAPGGVWTAIKTVPTGGDGGFVFGLQPEHSARYDVWVPSVASCERAVSSPALALPVAVKVVLTGPTQGVPAGNCGTLKASVQPPHPATAVQFQRLVGSTWTTIGTAPTGTGKPAAYQACEQWADMGTQTWRAVWSAADAQATDNADGLSTSLAVQVVKAPWMVHIDQLIGSRNVGVAVASGGALLYEHADTTAHVPASNEKLLLSMALLDRTSAQTTIPTIAEAAAVNANGVIHGGLWLVGRGDPTLDPKGMQRLADAIQNAGVKQISGSVRGSTEYFSHDWFAPGWKPEFPAEEVAMPTALTYQGNTVDGRHVQQPERVAAAALTRMLRARGIKVIGDAKSGVAPAGLQPLAQVSSPPLRQILQDQNVDSINFDAEVLGKLLGVMASGQPGTIAKGAAAMHAWAASHGVTTTSEDASGLSYSNRVTSLGLVRLLQFADSEPWGPALRSTLATPGEGTLEHRLHGIDVQAKTGTLDNISALSGWVGLTATGHAAEFSILSGGFDESAAKDVEDQIVTTLANFGH